MVADMKLWGEKQLHNHVYHMDCMKLFEKIPDKTVSLILTDPPYGISYRNHFAGKSHSMLQGDDGIDYGNLARECYRILKDDSHAYFFTRYDCYAYHYHCLLEAGFQIKNCLVIEKGTVGGIGDLQGSYANNCEWVIFCQKGKRQFEHTHLLRNKKAGAKLRNRVVPEYKTRFPVCWFGGEYPKSTYNATWQRKNAIYHPTVKNIDCLAWLIQLSSRKGELVFDGYMGVGSTALAALQTGRHYLGAEIDSQYYEIICDRLQVCGMKGGDTDGQPVQAGRD